MTNWWHSAGRQCRADSKSMAWREYAGGPNASLAFELGRPENRNVVARFGWPLVQRVCSQPHAKCTLFHSCSFAACHAFPKSVCDAPRFRPRLPHRLIPGTSRTLALPSCRPGYCRHHSGSATADQRLAPGHRGRELLSGRCHRCGADHRCAGASCSHTRCCMCTTPSPGSRHAPASDFWAHRPKQKSLGTTDAACVT